MFLWLEFQLIVSKLVLINVYKHIVTAIFLCKIIFYHFLKVHCYPHHTLEQEKPFANKVMILVTKLLFLCVYC